MSPNSSSRGPDAGGKPRAPEPGKTNKLKDSCTNCAYSKLKCSKEKPVCSRCQQRSLTCEYEASRRTGRRSHATKMAMEKQQREQQEAESKDAAIDLTTQPEPVAPVAQMLPVADETTENPLLSLHTSFTDFSDTFPAAAGGQPFADFSNTLPSANMLGSAPSEDMQGLFGGDVDGMLPPLTSYDAMDVSSEFDSSSWRSDDVWSNSIRPRSSSGSVTDMSQHSISSDLPSVEIHAQPSIERSNCCLDKAIGFVTRLFSNTSAANPLSTVDWIIAENRRIFCELIKILACQCAEDGYLLATVALMVFKAIAWYASIPRDNSSMKEKIDWNMVSSGCVCQSINVSESSCQSKPNCSSRFDQTRDPAQLVLSELSLVQKLVNILSRRMHSLRMRSPDANSNFVSDHSTETLNGALPLSSMSLDQLEVDLRKRLRDVCALLRQESLFKSNSCRTAIMEGMRRGR